MVNSMLLAKFTAEIIKGLFKTTNLNSFTDYE